MYHEKTETAAKGKWRGILLELGIPAEILTGKHAKCPLCTSKDNFRWDNQDGRGTYICTCGAGNGMRLAIEFTGQSFSQIATRIDDMLGNIKPESASPRAEMTDDERRSLLRSAYAETIAVSPGDLVHTYLSSRHIGERIYPAALRFAPRMRDGDGGVRPCMVAMVGLHGETDGRGRQKFRTLHRTFLRPDGLAKAEMASPRKMMPGAIPDGSCVMLSEWTGHGPIGIAEGIETALSASALFDMPVWAALNATMMEKWLPPAGADEVAIFADHDANYRGHRAAGILANRLATKPEYAGMTISIHMPQIAGTDWADERAMQIGRSA